MTGELQATGLHNGFLEMYGGGGWLGALPYSPPSENTVVAGSL